MAVTYVLSSVASDLTGGADFTNLLDSTTAAAAVINVSIAKNATEDSFGFTKSGLPGVEGTSTGTFTVKVNITTGNTSGDLSLAVALARVDKAGTQAAITAFSAAQATTAGIKTFRFLDPALGTWAHGDRLKVIYRWVNLTKNAAQALDITVNTIDAEVVTPFAPPPPPSEHSGTHDATANGTTGSTGFVGAPVKVVTNADAHVRDDQLDVNFGTATELLVDGGAPVTRAFLRFDLSTQSGTIAGAVLRLFCSTNSSGGTAGISTTDNTWTETGVTWNNKPAPITAVGTTPAPNVTGTWFETTISEVDIQSAVGGVLNFIITANSTGGALYSSREGTNPPELVLQFASPASSTTDHTGSFASTADGTSTASGSASVTSVSASTAEGTSASSSSVTTTGSSPSTADGSTGSAGSPAIFGSSDSTATGTSAATGEATESATGTHASTAAGTTGSDGSPSTEALSASTTEGSTGSTGSASVTGTSSSTATGTTASSGTTEELAEGTHGSTATGTTTASGSAEITGTSSLTVDGTTSSSDGAATTESHEGTHSSTATGTTASAGSPSVSGGFPSASTGSSTGFGSAASSGGFASNSTGTSAASGFIIVSGEHASSGTGSLAFLSSIAITGALDSLGVGTTTSAQHELPSDLTIYASGPFSSPRGSDGPLANPFSAHGPTGLNGESSGPRTTKHEASGPLVDALTTTGPRS